MGANSHYKTIIAYISYEVQKANKKIGGELLCKLLSDYKYYYYGINLAFKGQANTKLGGNISEREVKGQPKDH